MCIRDSLIDCRILYSRNGKTVVITPEETDGSSILSSYLDSVAGCVIAAVKDVYKRQSFTTEPYVSIDTDIGLENST